MTFTPRQPIGGSGPARWHGDVLFLFLFCATLLRTRLQQTIFMQRSIGIIILISMIPHLLILPFLHSIHETNHITNHNDDHHADTHVSSDTHHIVKHIPPHNRVRRFEEKKEHEEHEGHGDHTEEEQENEVTLHVVVFSIATSTQWKKILDMYTESIAPDLSKQLA